MVWEGGYGCGHGGLEGGGVFVLGFLRAGVGVGGEGQFFGCNISCGIEDFSN